MPDDQTLRRQLIRLADEVQVDTEGSLTSVLAKGRARIRRRRAAALVAVPVAAALVVVTVVIWAGAGPRRDQGSPAAPPSRITGTWERTVAAGEGLPAEASGTWTMVLGSDGALTLAPPDAWTARYGQPTGVYRRTGDALRTNVLASELCSGAAGAYSFTTGLQLLDLNASSDPCVARRAVLAGRWERAP